MTFDFMDRRSAERFAELLDETTVAGRRHQRQHRRGPADEQLAELVTVGHSLSAAKPGIQVDPEFRVGLRAMLVATAERDGIGRTAAIAESDPVADAAAAGKPGVRAGLLGRSRRIRVRGAIVIGVAAGALAVSGISAASENASPGDPLYQVKRSTERAQLAIAGSNVNRGQLSLGFARNRLAEAAAMPGDTIGFAGVLDDMDADTRKGVRLLTTSAVARRDAKPLNTIDDFAVRQRQTLAPVLDRLAPANRERAQESLALLAAVQQRAEVLRAGLDCTPVVPAGVDDLGAKLRDCASTTAGTTRSRVPATTGKSTAKTGGKQAEATPQPTAAAVAPGTGATAGTTVPGTTRTSTSPDAVSSNETPSPSPTPLLTGDEEDGVLGGLLGGLFDGA